MDRRPANTTNSPLSKDPKARRSQRRPGSTGSLARHSFAAQDAQQWAEWGVDYLKYDWIPNDVPHVTEMADALRATGRDIVYSLSNTGALR